MSSALRAKSGARSRTLLLSTASTAIGGFLALAAIGAPGVALAQDECGVAAPGGDTVTCTSAGNPYPNGITYFTPAGDLTINLDGDVVIDTSGGLNAGILGLGLGTDALTINGLTGASITTDADGGFGILGATTDGDLAINISSINTSGVNAFGIVGGSATGNVTVNAGTITTTGLGANAVDILTNSGDIAISGLNVSTTGDNAFAVNASSDAGGDVSVTGGTFSTTGAGSVGIRANADLGSVSVTPTTVTTTSAGATGILVTSNGVATIGVSRVAVTGAGASGIVATSATEAVNVNVNGAGVTSTQADAMTLTGLTVSVNTQAGSVINGQTAGIRATSINGTGVTNRGTIGSSAGYAIDVTGGLASITNTAGAVINGRVRLSDSADVINNAGTVNAAGVSLFGAGADTVTNTGTWNANAGADFGADADVFNNSGNFNVLNGVFPVGNVTFANLETFNNTGRVSLQNGRAGDSFTLPGVFNGGAGSRLALDVNFTGATPVADRLIIGSATGSTGVQVNNVGGGVLTPGVVIVDGVTASPTTAFVLDPSNVNLDLVQYQIVYDAPTANFLLIGTPQSVVFQQALAGEAAGNLWRKTSDSWSNHMSSVRDGAWAGDQMAMSEGAHVWGEFLAGSDRRDTDGGFTTFGVNQTVDLGYDQDYVGYQGGIDWYRPMGSGTLAMGVTGGYAGSYLNFNDDGGSIDFTGFNVGASVGYSQGGLFVNGLLKADFLKGDTTFANVAQRAEFDAQAYGAALEGGYRFGGSAFFVEPVVSLSYVRTEMDDFDVMNSSISYDDNDSLRGKLGLRGGGVWNMSSGGRVIPYGAVYAVEEFEGEDGLTFTNGGIDLAIANLAPETYGQAQLGLGFSPWTGPLSGFTGYVQADGNFGNDMSGGGVRLGFRFKW
ncbi:autotransporter outer membrane beta-barrel domain-containing protein [Caulobacter sp. NIBR1757]|uniref:autotransporter outer membrane beta-barrel domain-containing protein n=1 Tax=Caulobacter sp. NIBR1757 TaxID=3016000 RepID=UPI0022F1213D|nr:autotransporter outer membrane beta-barrel domain-containing protein [Caulobacter sp. NIBR1757]